MAASDDDATGEAAEKGTALLEMLKQEHRALLESFHALQQCNKGERNRILELFGMMAQEFQRHMEGEERFLYTSLERHDGVRDLVLESFEEHHLARQLLAALQAMAFDDERWGAKLAVLRRMAEAHMAREEATLFAVVDRVLDGGELQRIWEQIQRLKREKTAA